MSAIQNQNVLWRTRCQKQNQDAVSQPTAMQIKLKQNLRKATSYAKTETRSETPFTHHYKRRMQNIFNK